MANLFSRTRERFILLPLTSNHSKQFVVYDSLLEQSIGYPHSSKKSGQDMVNRLNQMAPTIV